MTTITSSGLENDKYATGESTLSCRTAIGRTDLRAKRPDTVTEFIRPNGFHISKRN